MAQLDDVLEQFRGLKPDDIAAMVKRRGIKGRMGTTYGCPMALLLDGQSTGTYVIGRRYIVRRSGRAVEKSRTPDNVRSFVRKFDIGGYPDLVAPPPRCVRQGKKAKPSGSDTNRHTKVSKKTPRVIVNHVRKLVGRFSGDED